MRDVQIKSVNRKTTISKAVIKRAAEIAYGVKPEGKKEEGKSVKSKKAS